MTIVSKILPNISHYYFIPPHCYISQSKQTNSLKSTSTTGILINSTAAFCDYLKKYSIAFKKEFKSKKFLHKYTEDGMDEMEFTEAICNVVDLVNFSII